MKCYHFCTYFDSNYLSYGLTLYKSLKNKCDIPFKLYVLCLDVITFEQLVLLDNENIIPIPVSELESWDEDLLTAKNNRNRIEYYFTLSPVLPLYILQHYNVDIVASLDADLMFLSSPTEIYNELGDNSIFIIEHRFREKFKHHEESGKFNVQCQLFRNDDVGLACLNRWREQCVEWCYDYYEDGKFADQKYLDEWPLLYGDRLVISKNIGVGVAPWNVEGERINYSDDNYYINDKPIVFYHFHGLKIFNRFFGKSGLAAYHATLTKPLRKLYSMYLSSLNKNTIVNKQKEIRAGSYGTVRLIMSGIKYKDLVIHSG